MTPGSLVTEVVEGRNNATVHVIFTSSEKEVLEDVQKMQDMIKRFTA
jgi:multisubunit Na+/H+ antiporter MnhE subunit